MKSTDSECPKVFIDTNIVLDYLGERTADIPALEMLVEASLDNKINLVIAAHSLTNIFYITRKRFSVAERFQIIKSICGICRTHPVSGEIIEKAIDSGYTSDLEDAVQIQCALESDCTYFITRDRDLFDKCPVRTLFPHELVRELSL